ncbi:MAG: hypothetical protein H8E44_38730 [Planctomycetes bacterium]|nr:hypothetical protein [Planctomycetota bacterium]MBL7044068.1 hypothetical protein [Pirellulaceae bacterium]
MKIFSPERDDVALEETIEESVRAGSNRRGRSLLGHGRNAEAGDGAARGDLTVHRGVDGARRPLEVMQQ